MKQSEFFSLGLPKWPALVVRGKSVTPEQAMEILIRTSSPSYSSNDSEFDRQLNEFLYDLKYQGQGYEALDTAIVSKLGIDSSEGTSKHFREIWDYRDKVEEDHGILQLQYLYNSQIVSCWVGGPHGWCNWDGTIFSNNYNIGKWPSVEEVFKEWKIIAKTFPFLDLRCQLMNHEADCEDMVSIPGPVVEFKVKDGKVKMKIPNLPLDKTKFGTENMYEKLLQPFRERGCTVQQFQKAITHVRNVMSVSK
jgi:hypothetical protein